MMGAHGSPYGARPESRSAEEFFALNLYARLEVPEGATDEEIRSSYRRLLKEVHPDLNSYRGEDQRARFDEIMRAANEARDTLLDPEKRARYDLRLRGRHSSRTGSSRKQWQRSTTQANSYPSAESPDSDDPDLLDGWYEMPKFVQRAVYALKTWWHRQP